MTEEEFIIEAIKKLRGKYRGLHSVYSGVNAAFRQQFGKDPVEVTNRMAREGKLVIRPARGGVILYLPGEAPDDRSDTVIRKVMGEE